MCAGCLPVIEQHAGAVVTILIRGVEIGEGRIVVGRIRDIALGADELSSGNLVAVDDGAVEGGHEDDGLDVGCRQLQGSEAGVGMRNIRMILRQVTCGQRCWALASRAGWGGPPSGVAVRAAEHGKGRT